jgi:hypothetical protein
MTNEEIYSQGYAISQGLTGDDRVFAFGAEHISVPSHHVMIELLDGREVVDINRVREVAELYRDERV